MPNLRTKFLTVPARPAKRSIGFTKACHEGRPTLAPTDAGEQTRGWSRVVLFHFRFPILSTVLLDGVKNLLLRDFFDCFLQLLRPCR